MKIKTFFINLIFIFICLNPIFPDIDVLFQDNFENMDAGAVPADFEPSGSGNPYWDDDLFNPGGLAVTANEIHSGVIGTNNYNISKKYLLDLSGFGTPVLLGANFNPSTDQYVIVEYDICLTDTLSTWYPTGEIYYADDYDNLDGSGTTKIAIHIQFSDHDSIADDSAGTPDGPDNRFYRTTGQDNDITSADGTEYLLTSTTFSLDTWYRIQVVADQVNKTFDVKITDKEAGNSWTDTGLPFNDTGAGYIRKIWFGITTMNITAYFDNICIYQNIDQPPVEGPTIILNESSKGPLNVNTGLNIDFIDETDLDSIQYKIGSGGSWTDLTTNGTNSFALPFPTTSVTDPVFITDTDFTNTLVQGENRIYFQATDSDANITESAGYLSFYKDTEIPTTATLTVPGTTTISSWPPNLQGIVGDGISGLDPDSAEFTLQNTASQYWDGAVWQGTEVWLSTTHAGTTDNSEVTWTDTTTLPATTGEEMTVRVRVNDSIGNGYYTSAPYTFTILPGYPDIDINSPSPGPTGSNTAMDVDFSDDTDLADIEYQIGGTGGSWTGLTLDGTTPIDLSGGGHTSYNTDVFITDADFTGLADGTHQVYFRAYDGTNETISSSYVILKKDAIGPATATITLPSSDPFFSLDTLAGKLADNTNGFGFTANSATFTIQDNTTSDYWNSSTSSWQGVIYNNPTTHPATTDSIEVSWVKDCPLPEPTDLTDGNNYTFEITITDRAGNITSTPVTLTYDPDSYTWTGNNSTDWDYPGNWNRSEVPVTGAEVTIPGTGITNWPQLSSAVTITDLTIENGGQLDQAGLELSVTGTFYNQGILRLIGNEAVCPVDNISGTVEYYGTGTYGPGLSGGNTYYNLSFTGTGSWTLNAALTVNNNLTITNGTVSLVTYGVSVTGTFVLGTNGRLQLQGNQAVTTPDTNSGTVEYTGAVDNNIKNWTYTHLEINDSTDTATFSLTAPLDVNGNLTITSGILNTANNNINVAGNWSNSGGFTAGNSTVILDTTGISIISGTTSFNDLFCNTSSKTIQFEAGSTQTITNTFTMQGTSGNEIILESTNPGTQWLLDVNIPDVSYVDVYDSDASIGNIIDAPNSSGNGNTDNWAFLPGPAITSVLADDPDDLDGIYSNEDTITVNFDQNTNEVTVAAKADLDAIFTFNENPGTNYTGAWSAADTLVITIEDATGATPPTIGGLTLTFNTGNGVRGAGLTLQSSGTSPVISGDWGTLAGPVITSVIANDPDDLDIVYSNDDTITIEFDQNTNQAPVATKTDLDTIFTFNENPGANYTGAWSAADTLAITIVDATGAAPPSIGGLTLTFNAGNGVKNAAGTSQDSTGTSPAITGDWGFFIPGFIEGSWTEDSNYNGKIDRIVVNVESPLGLNDNFIGMIIEVSGYDTEEINSGDVLLDDIFHIELAEKPYLDTDATPVWQIISSGNLLDTTTSQPVSGTEEIIPHDQALPIIAYTLAVADKDEIFVCFSEPVQTQAGEIITSGDFTYSTASVIARTRITSYGTGTKEVLLTLDANITATEIAEQRQITTMILEDAANNSLVSQTHRVTDLGLGLAGNGIIQPVWAQDETGRDPEMGGIGYISLFDSSEWLRDQTITLQAHIHDDISGAGLNVKLYFDVNVSGEDYMQGNLWLPPFNSEDYNGMVPYPNPNARELNSTEVSDQLRNFTISANDSEIADSAGVEFLFEIPSIPIYCAGVADPDAANWYRTISPWGFSIHDIIKQESDVTILNNVINPTLGEQTYLHYILSRSGTVTINVFDLKGDIVDVLYRGRQSKSDYSVSWDGRNRGGRIVARGVYFIKIVAPEINEIRKVLVVK